MALQSQFTRIETAILQLIKPDTLTSEQMRELIYPVLELEMVEHDANAYSVQEIDFTFKELDGDVSLWRRIENAEFTDFLSAVDENVDCIIETLPEALDFTGKQIAFVVMSRQFDANGGGTCYWDINLDAVEDDLDAGEFLTDDLSAVLEWDTVTPLDVYPTRKVVLRLTMAGAGELYWIRVRMAVVGSLDRMAKDTSIISHYAVARWFDQRVNKALNANAHPATIQMLQNRATHFRNRANGRIDGGSAGQTTASTGAVGGTVAGSRPSNPWSDKLTGKV